MADSLKCFYILGAIAGGSGVLVVTVTVVVMVRRRGVTKRDKDPAREEMVEIGGVVMTAREAYFWGHTSM